MTREEKQKAIDALKISSPMICMTQNEFNDYYQTLDKIMDWLEQEPCEDCISRAELLKAIDTWDKFGIDDTNHLFRLDNLSLPHYVSYIHYDDVIKCIKGMPRVQPKTVIRDNRVKDELNRVKDELEPKTGHWKIIPFSNNYGEYRPKKYMCSECGWKIDLCRGLQQDTGHRLFCEHCGARMKGGE